MVSESELMTGSPPARESQVTLTNWRTPPFNRWAFQHVQNLVPTAPVERGAGPVWALEQDIRDLSEVRFTDHEGRNAALSGFLKATQTDGFLVLHRGKVVTEQYFNGLTPQRPHILMSVSKSLTATLAGILIGQGELDPGKPVIDFVPELDGSAFEDCTLQHILDMTVGIDFTEDYLADQGLITEYREVSGWNPPGPDTVDGDLRSWLPTLRKRGRHGACFHYVSPCSDLLGWILERVGRQPFSRLFADLVWSPMGAEFDAYVTVDRLGAPRTAGGICVTLRDLARFGQLALGQGCANGRQIVPAAWFEDTVSNHDRAAWAAQDPLEFLPNGGYRNKWWMTGNENGAFTGIGVYGQWLYIDPAAQMVVAVFASQPLPVDDIVADATIRCFEAISQMLTG